MEQVSPAGSDAALRSLLEIKLAFKAAMTTRYLDPSYDGNGDLVQVTYWQEPAMTTLLFTKTLTYDPGTGDLTRVDILEASTGRIYRKDLTYDGNGDWASSNETLITP